MYFTLRASLILLEVEEIHRVGLCSYIPLCMHRGRAVHLDPSAEKSKLVLDLVRV